MFQLKGDHTPQPPWEGLFRGTGVEGTPDSRTSDSGGAMWFSPWTWNSGSALHPTSRVLKGAWEFSQTGHMWFVDLEKAFHRVPLGVLWGVLQDYGVSGHLFRAVRVWSASPAVSRTSSPEGLRSARDALYHRFCS